MSDFDIRPLAASDQQWAKQFLAEQWGTDFVIAHGVVYHPRELPGFVAMRNDTPVGLLTYNIEGDSCEIVTIDSLAPSSGIGTALIEAVKAEALRSHCRRLWLITTNDNLNALRFYQKRGFVLAALHRNALERSRKLKPQISLIGEYGIPMRDELELEMWLK
jgi:ribosomal protein S18 acetylase RimI-like enzyme